MACGGVSKMERTVNRTEGFTTDFFQHIQNMKGKATFSNFLLKIKGQEIHCHKLVLSANSDYFSTLFSKPEMKEVQQGFVEFDTLNFTALKKCIDYCYSGKIDLHQDDIKELVEVVEHLQMLRLKEHLSAFIADIQNSQNCIEWYRFADRYSLDAVRDKARQVMVAEFCDVVKTPDFLDLTHVELIDYIKEADADPDVTLSASVQWIMHVREERVAVFEEILKIVDLKQCSPGVLKHILEDYDELITTFDTLKQITKAALSPVKSCNPLTDSIDHKFYVLGGNLDDNSMNVKSYLIELATGSISEKASVPDALQNINFAATCVTPLGMIFIGGNKGALSNTSTAQCILYARSDDVWVSLPGPSKPAFCSGAICVGDCVFLVGGHGERKHKVECFDLKSYKWRSCQDMLQGIALPIVGAVGDSIHVIFNTSSVNIKGKEITCQCFDTVASSWSFKASLPQSVSDTRGASAITLDDIMYVIGGQSKLCARYNTHTDQWTVLRSSIKGCAYGAVMNVKETIVICGGEDTNGKKTDSFEKYNPSTDTWEMLSIKLPVPLCRHSIL